MVLPEKQEEGLKQLYASQSISVIMQDDKS